MKKQRDQGIEVVTTLKIWEYLDACKAVPYLRSLVQSLREGWLQLRQSQRAVERAQACPRRPNRDAFIQLEESQRDLLRAEAGLEEIVGEMILVSVYSIDSGAGLAVISFLYGELLVWYVFDLFDPEGFVGWRLHSNPLETRRPLAELGAAAPSTVQADQILPPLPHPPVSGFEKLN